uniref:putative reverse transcriptase/maturase n=1 Tax=Goniotrichopsis reniformis TaxID=468933 RepID=UPI001FCDE737|nr:putative reverse transcriptase/maturase [Goniotrichopsis reniformis]UNJ14866.1 putative reverse transcriptase/maturase [Goniotrichopsis reniformis]
MRGLLKNNANKRLMTSTILTTENAEWINFNWKAIENRVKFLRFRIFNASKRKDFLTARHLQELMLNSSANILLSIRRITALNQNVTGIDKIRTHLVHNLMTMDFSNYFPINYQNLTIPKTQRKQKILRIHILKDHCIQMIIKNALEPQWEAYFEDNVYGNRPGRCSHDAINHLTQILRKYPSKKWIVQSNFNECLESLNGQIILKRLANFPRVDLIFKWIKADYLSSHLYRALEAKLPQSNIITALLGNIALDEMDKIIKKNYSETTSRHFYVRYDDVMVLFCETKDEACKARELIIKWAKNINIKSSSENFSIEHITQGFNFLGVHIIPQVLDNITISIYPNQKAIQDLRSILKAIWMRGRGKDVQWVLNRLNPRIREWCNYYSFYKSTIIFKEIDNWMFQRSVRYCKRTHPNKSWAWMQQKYFGRFNAKKSSKWIFGDKESGKYLLRLTWTPVRQYIPIQIQASPDNILYQNYWSKRNSSGITNNRLWNISDFKIAHKQNHLCPICNSSLYNNEPIEKHRIIVKKSSKRLYSFSMIFVHVICYECVKLKSIY